MAARLEGHSRRARLEGDAIFLVANCVLLAAVLAITVPITSLFVARMVRLIASRVLLIAT